jgi:hypothetical protein
MKDINLGFTPCMPLVRVEHYAAYLRLTKPVLPHPREAIIPLGSQDAAATPRSRGQDELQPTVSRLYCAFASTHLHKLLTPGPCKFPFPPSKVHEVARRSLA